MEELWKTIDDGGDSVYQRAQLLQWIQRWEAAQIFHEWPAQRFQPPMIPPVFMPPNPTTAAPSPVPQSESSYGSAELFRPSMIIAVGTLDMTSVLDIVRYILLCVTLTVTVFIAQLSHLKSLASHFGL